MAEQSVTPTLPDLVARLEALEKEATPGDWRWAVNLSSKTVHIETTGNGRMLEYVMDFERWGMQRAKPVFLDKAKSILVDMLGLLKPVPGREHHKSWHQTIDHPDAIIMVEARNALPLLLAEMKNLRSANERMRAALRVFAKLAITFDGDADAKCLRSVYGRGSNVEFTVGDLRRAAEAVGDE